MIEFHLSATVTCAGDQCGACFSLDIKMTGWRLKKLIEAGDDALAPNDIPTDWGFHTSGGWGMTNYTKTQLLCRKCIEKWDHGTVKWGNRVGPLTQIAAAANKAAES